VLVIVDSVRHVHLTLDHTLNRDLDTAVHKTLLLYGVGRRAGGSWGWRAALRGKARRAGFQKAKPQAAWMFANSNYPDPTPNDLPFFSLTRSSRGGGLVNSQTCV